MFRMFDWLRRKNETPLAGAPAVRREKTYSAESGYVYQYHYEGHRPATRDGEHGTEYVFQVTADRKTAFPVSAFLGEGALTSWEGAHGRKLTATERYAVAKMSLFHAFDERPDPGRMREEIRLRPADVAGILEALDIG